MSSQRETKIKPASVFDYSDYRHFLRDWYHQTKKQEGLSLRSFSEKAGFTSSNYLKLVMDGDRNLSAEGLAKFAKAVGLNKQESQFFESLVLYNQAKTHDEKNKHYQALLKSKKFVQMQPIARDKYSYYSQWYHPVIREMVTARSFDGDLEALSERLLPKISVTQVQKSIRLLEKLGFIQKDDCGKYLASSPVVTTGAEAAEVSLSNYHENVLDLAKWMLDAVPQEKRDISAMTLGISKSQLGVIKSRIQEFRRDILNLVSTQDDPDDVVLLTIQLLPVTQQEGAPRG